MTQIKDGGPAFPFIQWRSPDGMISVKSTDGMSLRDHFAGQALVGLLSTYSTDEVAWEKVASRSYGIADAMLAAREVKP